MNRENFLKIRGLSFLEFLLLFLFVASLNIDYFGEKLKIGVTLDFLTIYLKLLFISLQTHIITINLSLSEMPYNFSAFNFLKLNLNSFIVGYVVVYYRHFIKHKKDQSKYKTILKIFTIISITSATITGVFFGLSIQFPALLLVLSTIVARGYFLETKIDKQNTIK